MSKQPAESDTPASPPSRLPRLIGRLGLYATCLAAAAILLALAGDLDVLVGHAALVGWLALLVGMGPLLAILFSALASCANFSGVWRVVRAKDEYDAGQDLKSHAAAVPQVVQAILASRAGRLPMASVVLLLCSLLLAVPTTVPAATPFLGELGGWNSHIGNLAFFAAPATPTPTVVATAAPTEVPTATPVPTATHSPSATTTATATPPPQPQPTATATPIPPVINFFISPTEATDSSCAGGAPAPPAAVSITLDNTRSNYAVSWQAITNQRDHGGNLWASFSPAIGSVRSCPESAGNWVSGRLLDDVA